MGKKLFLIVSVIYIFTWCQAPDLQKEDLLDLDYYFGSSWIQIQGISRLPDERVVTKDEKSKANDLSNTYHFLTLTERRKNCHQDGLLNAHSKFLSISNKKWLAQSEWLLRLKLGARGDWSDCLDEARVVDTFYDIVDSCRLVVRYNCDPGNY